MQATPRDLREGEKRQSKVANDRTWRPPVLRPSRARPLAATWVAMRLKSGKAGDSFWPGARIRARIQRQSCNRARFAVWCRREYNFDPTNQADGFYVCARQRNGTSRF